MLDMVQPLVGTVKAITNLNTSVIGAMKPNAIPLLVRYQLIIVRIEKKRFAKN